MPLSPFQYNRLQQLLGIQQSRQLSFLEQVELQNLLAQQYPQAKKLTGDDLVKLGLFAVGAWLLFRKK